MIEDEELRLVFQAASEEHLQSLDTGLLHLEKHPNDHSLLESLMRDAHSLKGDANMLGVREVGTLAHQLEHILSKLSRQEVSLSAELSDRLAQTIVAIHQLVREAVTGEPATVDSFHLLAALMSAESNRSASDSAIQTAEILVEERSEALLNGSFSTSTVAPQFPNYRIETIRVPTHNLDGLMTQAGELTVTKIRIAHRLAEVEAITHLWEEWSRDLFSHRFVSHEVQQSKNGLHRLGQFHNRTETNLERLGSMVKTLRTALYEDTARLELISDEMESDIRTLRLLPLSTIFNLFPRMVRDLARQEGKSVELVIEGGETKADKRILEEMKDPLMHILRNAVDHGIESPTDRQRSGKPATATLRLRGYQTPSSIVIEVIDDGIGLNLDNIKQTALKRGVCREEELATLSSEQIQSLIFIPGFSTAPLVTEVSGRGVGLDVVRTNVEKLKGSIRVESLPGKGCTFRMQLGITLATAHVLITIVNGNAYAIPVEYVRMACLVSPEEIFILDGRNTIARSGHPISVAKLADLLELPLSATPQVSKTKSTQLACVLLQVGQSQFGVFVDALLDEQDVVIKPQSQLLKRVRNISGATILGTGEVCMVLHPPDLMKSIRRRAVSIAPTQATQQQIQSRKAVLLVEDSIATRTQEKRILEAAGYEVMTAVDGLDGFNKLQSRSFDAVVSDVQMPNLDGLGLTARIRQHREYNDLPIILVTSLASDEDKRRGAEAGANAYITKGNFNQDILLETLNRLI